MSSDQHIATSPDYYLCQSDVLYLCILLPPLLDEVLDQLLILLVQLALLQAATSTCTQCMAVCNQIRSHAVWSQVRALP